ncbi:hypothetical protein BD414DRAFT_104657 [Trametes punicea]|nr:hypothetical protein BD414DRAFT_104657 [Trametes punicea]
METGRDGSVQTVSGQERPAPSPRSCTVGYSTVRLYVQRRLLNQPASQPRPRAALEGDDAHDPVDRFPNSPMPLPHTSRQPPHQASRPPNFDHPSTVPRYMVTVAVMHHVPSCVDCPKGQPCK